MVEVLYVANECFLCYDSAMCLKNVTMNYRVNPSVSNGLDWL
jgi:hypothetical protein